MLKLTIICGAILVIFAIITVIIVFPVYRDIDQMISRAQLGADAERIVEYLDQVISNMERYRITQGSAAMIFKTPLNDVGLNYQALKDLRDRATLIAKLKKDSVEYQTGLDDIRGTLREIDVHALYYKIWHNFAFWIVIADVIIFIILWIGWLFDWWSGFGKNY